MINGDPLGRLELEHAVPCHSTRGDRPWIVTVRDRRLLLPEGLLAILRLHRLGLDEATIAAEVRSDPVAVSAALERTRRKVGEILDRPEARGGHVARRELISAGLAARLARPLAPLFGAKLGLPLVALGSLLVVAALAVRPSVPVNGANFWGGYALALAVLLVHELGHAAACLRSGVAPGPIGATIYLVFPAFYADVSAAWELSRGRRLLVDIGGVHLQVIATGLLGAAAMATRSEILQAGVLFSVASLIMTLNPILKMDGYWLVADALGVPNLGRQLGARLRRLVDRLRRRPVPPTSWPAWVDVSLTIYAAVSVAFLVMFATYVVPWLVRCVLQVPATLVDAARSPASLLGPKLFEVLMTLYGAVLAFVYGMRLVRFAIRVVAGIDRRATPS